MKYQRLIARSKIILAANAPHTHRIGSMKLFEYGAKWMFDQLNERGAKSRAPFNHSINFSAYGTMKYGLSFFIFLLSIVLFIKVNALLLPLSIIIFYLVEVHFLFLFPILIDNIQNPVRTSIRQTYKTGILLILITVIPIGFFMVFGLLKSKDPLRNWYVGCNAILIWYEDEIRNRL